MNRDVFDEKDMLELFNYIDVDNKEKENDDTELKMDALRKKRLRNNLLSKIKGRNDIKRFRYKSAAAVLIVAVSLGLAVPALAKNIPALKSIIEVLNGSSYDQGEYEKYSKTVNKSVTDNGITLTINEVLCDESTLMIGYTIKSEGDIKEIIKSGKDIIEMQRKDDEFVPFTLIRSLKIDGKPAGSGSYGEGKYLDDHTYINSETMDIGVKNLPPFFDVYLDVKNIHGIKGNWSFKFSVLKDEILKNTKVFKPNTKVKFPGTTITVEKVSFTPINTSIQITGKYNKEEYKNVNKRGDVFKHNAMLGDMLYDKWFVFDDKGDEITVKGGSVENSSISDFQYDFKFVSLKNIPKYLTVIPYRIDYDTDDYKRYKSADGSMYIPPIHKSIDGVYPIELSQGKIGKLIIKEIKIEEDKTIVRYTAEGQAPFYQVKHLSILDEKDEVVKAKNNDFSPKKDKNTANDYIEEFEPLDKNKKYKIGTTDLGDFEVRNDLKFKIQLDNK